jgi:hypothetical protein
MWKPVLAAATVLTIAGSSLVLAQQTSPVEAPRDGAAAAQRGLATAEDLAALTDARVAALKTGLKLTADQEKNWPPFEAAIRDLAKERADRMAAGRDARASRDRSQPRPDAIERLRSGAAGLAARSAALKKLADAAEPLYKSLDDGQKRRFSVLMRAPTRQGGMWNRRGG